MDHFNLIREISSLERAVDEAERSGKGWKEVWEQIKAIGRSFKETRFPTKDEKNEAWAGYQRIVDRVKLVQEKQRGEGERQLRKLESEVSSLESKLPSSFWGGSTKPDWKEVWNQIKEIQQAFRELGYVDKDKREAMWRRFQKAIDRVKGAQEDERKERQRVSDKSSERKDEVIRLAEAARPPRSNIVGDILDSAAKMYVTVATAGLISFDDLNEEKYALQECSKKLKEAWSYFNQRKDQILPRDRHEAWEKLTEVGEELDSAWDQWKRANQKRREAFQEVREERKRRHDEYQSRLRDRIARKETQLENLRNILSKKESHLSDLYDKLADAWSDSYRDRVDEWIDEERDRIADINRKISELEDEISELNRKLD